jgi:transcription termination/antitermination protein NusG
MENSSWFVLHVRSRFEHVVSSHLLKRNIDHYLPWRRITRRSANGPRSIEVPLLPKSVFFKAHPMLHPSLLTIPGVLALAGSGGMESAVSERQVSDLKRIVETGSAVHPWPFPPSGKKVTLRSGPLKGVSGILGDTPSARVLIVSIVPLRRSLAVEVDHHYTFCGGAGVCTVA